MKEGRKLVKVNLKSMTMAPNIHEIEFNYLLFFDQIYDQLHILEKLIILTVAREILDHNEDKVMHKVRNARPGGSSW